MTPYISNLRNIATFAVILVHATAMYVNKFGKINLIDWQLANFIDSSLRFCVPIFLMISGVLFLNKDEELSTFINKRFKRVALPFIFWNLIYFICTYYKSELPGGELLKIFTNYYIEGGSYHFWYIYLILGIYLFIPILRKWTLAAKESDIRYFLFFWIITLFINDYTLKYIPKIELMYFSKYIGFLVLGHYLHTYVPAKRYKYLGVLFFFIGVLLTFCLTSFFSLQKNVFISLFYEYLSPNVVLSAVGVFLMIKNLNFVPNATLLQFDSLSYGIYLVHILVLNKLTHSLAEFNLPVLANILVLSIGTYFISFVIIYLLKRVRFLNKIVG